MDNNHGDLGIKFPDIGEKDWFFLYWIAMENVHRDDPISTPEFCKIVPFSQQTVSRRIIELVNGGYLDRKMERLKGGILSLTDKGYEQLNHVLRGLTLIFSRHHRENVFSGILRDGMGEGGFYIKHEEYLNQFKDKLGFSPYFGTLNLQIDPFLLSQLEIYLKEIKPITINGFRDQNRSYGDVVCFPVIIWKDGETDHQVEGALLKIQRTSHNKNIIEFISPKYLRDFFDLESGDRIYFKIKE